MSVCSGVPCDTCDATAICTAIAVGHDLVRPAERMNPREGHCLLERQQLLKTMKSGLGNMSGSRQKTLSTATKCDCSHDDGAFFFDVMPDFVGKPSRCSTPCTNTFAKTVNAITAGPSSASSYSIFELGCPMKQAIWNGVLVNTAARSIHAGAAKATSLPAHGDGA